MSTKVKGNAIKEGSIPLSALEDNVKGNFYGKYGLNNYLGELIDTNPLFIEGPRPLIYMLANNKIYQFGQGVYSVYLSGNGPSVTITGSQTSEGWTFTANSNFVKSYKVKFYADKIDVETPTPDWNAQKGEVGYIENKPFYFNNNVDIHFLYEPESDTVMYEGALEDNDYAFFRICTNISGVEDNGDEPIYVFHKVKADNSYKFMDEDYGIEYNICVSNISIELSINTEFISKDTICKYVGLILPYNVRQLGDNYFPDTVLKTTPQTLSNTAKNRALANLGIDPVVWKYMITPFILKNGGNVPDELLNSDGKLKYNIPNMYRINAEALANYQILTPHEMIDGYCMATALYTYIDDNDNEIVSNIVVNAYMYDGKIVVDG